jgi:hypothetical protein
MITHLALDELDHSGGRGGRGALGHRPDQGLVALEEHDGRGDAITFAVGHDFRFPGRADYADGRVCGAQVYSDSPTHRISFLIFRDM